MDSTRLTRRQVKRLAQQVAGMLDYQVRLYQRCEASGFPLQDPLVVATCRSAEALSHVAEVVREMHRRLPGPYRPLTTPTKRQGLREVLLPWATTQVEAARAVERHEQGVGPAAVRGDEEQTPAAPSVGA